MGEQIAILLPSLNGGGIERVMLNLAIGLHQRGKEVDLLLVKAVGPLLEQVPATIPVINLDGRKTVLALPALVKYLQGRRPTAVISALECVNLINVWGRVLSRVPYRCILTTHTTVSRDFLKLPAYKRWMGLLSLRLFYSWADRVLAVSEGVARDVAVITHLPEGRVEVAYNPVVTHDMLEAASRDPAHSWFDLNLPPVILGVGRLSAEKDFVTLIRAFAIVSRKRDCRLMILGEGPARLQLEELVTDLGLEGKVELGGFRPNPYAFLARAAVFVLSSRYEGLPTVLIEALALGRPVVATNCRYGPDEILRGGEYGELVAVGDSEGMAAAIERSLSSEKPAAPEVSWEPFKFESAVDRYLSYLA